MARKIKVNEYTVVEDLANGVFKVLRHEQEWRDLTGDNFILSLVMRLEDAERLLGDAQDTLDDAHGYNSQAYRDIENYFEER